MSFTGIPELKQSYRQLGPAKFWLMVVVTLSWIFVGAWLAMSAQWQGQCDHSGRKLWGLMKQLHCSPELLSGGAMEIGLFVWLWSMPLLVAGCLIYAFVRKLRGTTSSSSQNSPE